MYLYLYLCVRACACEHACARVRACVCARALVRVCACVATTLKVYNIFKSDLFICVCSYRVMSLMSPVSVTNIAVAGSTFDRRRLV